MRHPIAIAVPIRAVSGMRPLVGHCFLLALRCASRSAHDDYMMLMADRLRGSAHRRKKSPFGEPTGSYTVGKDCVTVSTDYRRWGQAPSSVGQANSPRPLADPRTCTAQVHKNELVPSLSSGFLEKCGPLGHEFGGSR